jgi:hypothetical protein
MKYNIRKFLLILFLSLGLTVRFIPGMDFDFGTSTYACSDTEDNSSSESDSQSSDWGMTGNLTDGYLIDPFEVDGYKPGLIIGTLPLGGGGTGKISGSTIDDGDDGDDGDDDDKDHDCAGVVNGSAYLDNCNQCVGGTTGKTECIEDCAGVWGGTAYKDNCDNCVGGTTGRTECTQDCAGVWGGTAYKDKCGQCAGGTTGQTACLPCGDLDKRVSDLFNNMYGAGDFAKIGSDAKNGIGDQNFASINVNTSNSVTSQEVDNSNLADAISSLDKSGLEAVAYNETNGSNMPFSMQDVHTLLSNYTASFQTLYLIGTQSIYALVITSGDASTANFEKYMNPDGSFKTGDGQAARDYGNIYTAELETTGSVAEATALAEAYIFQEYNIGVTLLEADGARDSQGNLIWGETTTASGTAIKTLDFEKEALNATRDGNNSITNSQQVPCYY